MRWFLSLLFLLGLLSACGTFEVGIESSPKDVPLQSTTPSQLIEDSHPAAQLGEPTPLKTMPPTLTPTNEADRPNELVGQANNHSFEPAISGNGRYVAFASAADNLVINDANGYIDVFVYDRQEKTVELVSRGMNGLPTNRSSRAPGISADGRWIVYESGASNIVPEDVNLDVRNIFIYDRETRQTKLVSRSRTGKTGNGSSSEPAISADGRWIVFSSTRDDLVPQIDKQSGESLADTSDIPNIYLYDRLHNFISLVSLSSEGERGNGASGWPAISSDGRWVVFWSRADNLAHDFKDGGIFLHDRSNLTTHWLAYGLAPTISPDGRWISFISSSSDITPGDGSYVFHYERESAEITPIAGYAQNMSGGRPEGAVSYSMDGLWLGLASIFTPPDRPLEGDWTNLTSGVFVRNLFSETYNLVDTTPDGLHGNGSGHSPSLSQDGRYVAFLSNADNLIPGDTNNASDIFVWDRDTRAIELASKSIFASAWYDIPEISIQVALPIQYELAKNLETNRRGSFAAYDIKPMESITPPYFLEIQLFSEASICAFTKVCDEEETPCFFGDFPDLNRYFGQREAYFNETNYEGFALLKTGDGRYFVSNHVIEGDMGLIREYTTFLDDIKIDIWIFMEDESQAIASDELILLFKLRS